MNSSEAAARGSRGAPGETVKPAERDRSCAEDLTVFFARVRAQSEALCEPLAIEDYGVQPMDDASPPKWHLAHTTWFFETFLLREFEAGYESIDDRYELLFNSYYNGIGNPFSAAQARLSVAAHGTRDLRLPGSCGCRDGGPCEPR